jgi:hypothetical protein
VQAGAPYSYGEPVPFDAILVRQKIFLCYKEGGGLFVEQIPTIATQQRERCLLVRSLSAGNIWTNAAFSLDTNGQAILTAHGRYVRDDKLASTHSATLIWRFEKDVWDLDLKQSKPDAARRVAYREWCLIGFGENERLFVKRSHTDPMTGIKEREGPTNQVLQRK